MGKDILPVYWNFVLNVSFDHPQHYFPIDKVYAGSTSDLTLNDEFDILWGHGENLKVVALVVRNIEYKLLYDIGNL